MPAVRARDRQRSRVYAWEDREVAPRDPSLIGFAAAQGMVDAIWADQGLRHPPRVERLPARRRARTLASATRISLRLPERTPSWVLLHELAHAMTAGFDGGGDGHGPVFLGVYARLLERYLRLPADGLLASMRACGLEVLPGARPVFLD